MMPVEVVKANSRLVPGSKFVAIPKMGHMFFCREIEKQVADTILDCFSEVVEL